MNRVILMGNLADDPNKIDTKTGTDLTKFDVAVNEVRTLPSGEKEKKATFVECKCFGKNAVNIHKFFVKGRKILVEGKLEKEKWEKDGSKRSKMVVIVENFDFCDKKPDNLNNSDNSNAPISYDSI